MRDTFTIYVDLAGSTAEHADYLAGHVSTLLRGMYLGMTFDGERFGQLATYGLDEGRNRVRVAADFDGPGSSKRAATRLAEFLLANAWDDELEAIFVSDGAGQTWHTAYGEARSFIGAAS